MSGSKLLRLCCLFLSLLLLVPSFSVVANAEEAEENLIDSDIRNWEQITDFYPDAVTMKVKYNSTFGYYYLYIPAGSSNLLKSGAVYNLTNLVVGENYSLNFRVRGTDNSLNSFSWFIGLGYIDYSTGEIINYPDYTVNLTTENCPVGQFTEFNINFNYSASLGQPCIFIQSTFVDSTLGAGEYYLYIDEGISLTRLPSETDKKLDGILGWLEDIKDSIVGLPETIKTNFITFFTDLQGKITDMKDGVTEKLGTISTEFSGYITGLGDRVSTFFTDLSDNVKGFFDDIWKNISEWFEKFKPRISVDFNFKSGALNTSTGEFEYPANNSYVLSDVIYVPEGVEMHLNYTTSNSVGLKYIPVTSDGEYSGLYDQYFSDFELLLDTSRYFRIETRSYSMGGLEAYVDVGWFTYFTYTLRHKIDIKIEEIKTSIHDFFVPPEGFFEEWKVTFDLMLSDNLGFIYQAPNFVIDIIEVVQEILQSDQEVNLVFPSVEFDIAGYHIELFKDTKVDFSFLEAGIWLTLYTMYKVMLYVIFALALIKYGMSTWERTMAN